MNTRRREGGYSLLELLITLVILGVIAAIALPIYSEALLRAHISSGINDAYSLQLAFKRYHVDHSAYPADGPFDLSTFEPLVSLGYFDGRSGTRFVNDQADGYDAPDDQGADQEYWLEFSLAYDPTVRFLVSDSDNAPLGGGTTHYDGIFMFRDGVLKPLSEGLHAMSQEPNPKPEQQRRTVLAPYLIRLETVQDGCGHGGAMGLDSWERTVVESVNGATGGCGNEWSALVVEGIALRTKCEADLRRLGSNPESLDVVRAQLVADAAVGIALMAETQQSVDLMVLSGKIDAAKKLSGFRNKIAQGVSTIKDSIGEPAFRNARAMSEKMTTLGPSADSGAGAPPTQEPHSDTSEEGAPYTGEPLDVDALIGELPDPFVRRRAGERRPATIRVTRDDEDPSRRIKGLLIVLAALVVVWAVLILPRLGRAEPLPVLTEQSMPQNEAIRELMARPPSLFVEVDGAQWRAMSHSERRQLVKEVGEIAAASGYTGVQFRDTNGSSVAQWLQSQGVWLTHAAISN